jgi:hypothetical protein
MRHLPHLSHRKRAGVRGPEMMIRSLIRDWRQSNHLSVRGMECMAELR